LRQLSDGGGVVALTRDSSEGVEIRRRLGRGLDLVFNGTNGQSTSFSDVLGRGAIRSESAGLAFEYPLGHGFLFHAGYTYIRQRIGGNIPVAFDLDRNRAALGFFYNQGLFP
jgi:pantoate kinase